LARGEYQQMAKHKILIVDDEADITETVATMLRSRGYDVITAFDGGDGLIKAKIEKPDLILLDIDMPLMNGIDVCAKLKADEATMRIPIVTLTKQEDGIEFVKADRAGANDYIVKPFSLPDLLIKLSKLLNDDDKIEKSKYWPRIILACLIYLIVNAYDYYMTISGILARKAREGNPIVQTYIDYFGLHNGVLIYKIIICSLITLSVLIFSFIYEYEESKRLLPEYILYGGSIVTLFAVAMWIILFN
jgi:CheY-like chemotaxis protein